MWFFGLDIVRSLAALSVVLFHALELRYIKEGVSAPVGAEIFAGGVDVFFVLSGFLMSHLAARNRVAGWIFFLDRLSRVGPPYWLLTLLIGGAILAVPSLSERPIDFWVVLRSLFFLPSNLGPLTVQTTVLPVGWTLVYEFFFYAIIAISIIIGRHSLAPIFVVLICGLQFFGDGFLLNHYSNPIVLEFVFGFYCYKLPAPNKFIARIVFFSCFSIITAFYFIGVNFLLHRFIFAGFLACIIVWSGANLLDSKNWLLGELASSSFSLYLTHLYSIKYSWKFIYPSAGVAGLVLLAVFFGWVFYRFIERPSVHWFKSQIAVCRSLPRSSQ